MGRDAIAEIRNGSMPSLPILVLNSGSSSIKFSIYEAGVGNRDKLFEGSVEGIGSDPSHNHGEFWIKSANDDKIVNESPDLPDLDSAFALIASRLSQPPFPPPAAIGHRMVNGGPSVTENQRITPQLISEMERYVAFAPLHSPIAIFIMRRAIELFPDTPNFLCLDSWFHRTLPPVAKQLPIPHQYNAMGIHRFGAHGLSYESIVAHLQPGVPQRLIVAHLGNGSSICAISNGLSIDTSMGLTPTGGLISGSRTGDIDPGVLLFILRDLAKSKPETKAAADELEKIVNKQSGLQGVSQLTNDMRTLREAIAKGNADARLAVDEFVCAIRKFIGAYTAVLGGLDMLVFTGGIGQNDADTRAEICAGLESLGIILDPQRNEAHSEIISASNSRVEVRAIPPAEDLMIVNHVRRLMDR
jgi:acetate kinase